jgi:hypothetical protein
MARMNFHDGNNNLLHHAILDSGSTDNVIPNVYKKILSNVRTYKSNLKIGDNSDLAIVGTGEFGALKNVLLCIGLVYPLISVKYLTKVLSCVVFYSENRAYILNYIKGKTRIVASATIDHDDGLYHIDDMNCFKILGNFPDRFNVPNKLKVSDLIDGRANIISRNVLLTQSDRPFYTEQEIKKGSARNFVKNSRQYLNLLQWCHVRLGHPSEEALKRMIKNQSVLGIGVKWDEVKNMELGLCDSCLKSRMHAFPVPASISRKEYQIFEYITCDYCPMSVVSVQGYRGIYVYGDKRSERLFGYLVKSKSEWLDTFKSLIEEYGPAQNENSQKVKILLTDYAREIHEQGFSEYLATNGIRLYNSAPYKHHQNLIERYIQTLKNMLRTIMTYNNAPPSYWCYAIMYTISTYNMLPLSDQIETRDEVFTGIKTDVSFTVPFYSTGWSQVSETERKVLKRQNDKYYNDRAYRIKMLGYPDPYRDKDRSNTIVRVKNSYIVWDLTEGRQ